MLFNSYEFALFFPIVLLIFYCIPNHWRKGWLLLSSLYFYMSWNPKYIILIMISIMTTYACGIFLDYYKDNNKIRKYILYIGLVLNIGILICFKYFDFILQNLTSVLKVPFYNNEMGFLLPVGISFYTFQALGYLIDVYKKKIKVEHNFLVYALFVAFFPQLVAGPIESAKNLLPQIQSIDTKKFPAFENIVGGGYLIIWGLFQKIVIADRIAILVNHVFDEYYLYGSVELILAAVGFAFQIYCDFASYSIIAVGAAQILGVKLIENFNTPYFALSIKEFWKKWHISLNNWFREYLYIPLGGNRCNKRKRYTNIMIVFLTSGLWHGASWTYVCWGGIHGIYQIIGEETKQLYLKILNKLGTPVDSISYKLGKIFTTFIFTTIAWIFFRATSIENAVGYLHRMITKINLWVLFDGSIYRLGLDRTEFDILIVSLMVLFCVDLVRSLTGKSLDVFLKEQCIWFQWIFSIVIIWMLFVFGQYGPNTEMSQFIYFQF